MKKTLLSLVLCVALVVTAMSAMATMPASAASGIDFLWYASEVYGNQEGLSFSYNEGTLVFNPTAEGQEVAMVIPEAGNLNEFPFFDIAISSDVDFDLCFNDPANGKWIFGAGDFCWAFDSSDTKKIPAGSYDKRIDLTGAYTWGNNVLPANAGIIQVIVIAKGAGTITVTKAQLTDGMDDFDVNTRDTSDVEWDVNESLIKGEYTNVPAPSAEDPQSNVTVKQNADGSWSYGNDNGMWPAASYIYDTPIVVNDSAAIEMDFTVTQGSNTTLYIFFNQDNPESYNNGSFIYIANAADVLNRDLVSGNYKGIVFLEDTIRKTIDNLDAIDKCKNADGDYVITGIKIFGTNNAKTTDNAVTIRKFNLLSLKDEETLPPTTQTTAAGQTTTMAPPSYVSTTKAPATTEATTVATEATTVTTEATTEATESGDTTTEATESGDTTTEATESGDTTTKATEAGDTTTKATEAGDTTTKATEAGGTEATKAPEGGDATNAPEGGNATTAPVTDGTTAPALDGTTAADGSVNTTVENATTTTNQVQNVGGDSAPTGDVTNATLFLVIAAIAAAVVTFSATAKKAKN